MQELNDDNNFFDDGNVGASLFKYNIELKYDQGVGMAWNARACNDLKYMNMPWLGMPRSTMTLDE